ncbi:MAG: phosphotransferase family protein [Paracoccaceae bacterium]
MNEIDAAMTPALPDTVTCSAASHDPSAQVAQGLTDLMTHADPAIREIAFDGLVRSAGGLSRENWSFDATWADNTGTHAHRLMLIRDAAGTLLKTERSREFAVLKALEDSRVPAPKVHWVDAKGRWLGAPSVVMERMPGICDYMILNGSRTLVSRLSLARDFIELMANIHAADWRTHGLGETLGLPDGSPSVHELEHWEGEYQTAKLEPQPELDYILKWLKKNAPEAASIVLVHGDFKPGNALVDDGRITAKLDWETAHLGDPLEDLGWVTNPVRKREHQITGHWEQRHIVEAYSALTGLSIRETDLLWWNLFSCWKLCVIQLTAVSEFVGGNYNRVFQTPTWLFRPMLRMIEAAS